MSSRTPALAVVAALALAATAVAAPAAAAPPDEPAAHETTTVNGYRNVGYYGQWQALADREATLKKLFVDADAGRDLTHLNYSFGNIAGSQEAIDEAREDGVRGLDGVEPYTCFLSDDDDAAAGETDTAGDAESDFLHLFPAEQSVLGVADSADQRLAGNLNQLRQVKRLHPDLKVHVSLGGWAWSKSFSDAVATPERRDALVESCVDLWIRGDLPEIDGRGGEGAAAGIFDGFDIDWEWPGAPDWAQEVGNSIDEENDRANLLAFMEELRGALDELGAEMGEHYEISAFLPASPAVIEAGGWNDPEFFQYLDFGNLQGYDLWGPWGETTGHQGNVHGDPAHNWGLGLDTVVASYTDAGIDPAKLNLGFASYGYGWQGAGEEAWGEAESPAWQEDGTAVLSWDQLKTRGLDIRHAQVDGSFDATYGYDAEAREWWTFDDPVAVAEKTRWALSLGLGGVDYWELAHDVDADLPAAGAEALRQAEPGPIAGTEPTTCDADGPWNAQTTYSAGDTVFLDGRVFTASWWTRGEEPGASVHGAWQTASECGDADGEISAWFPDAIYTAGDQVTHGGEAFTARWWTRGDEPGASDGGPWER